jgi:hypothetical protein
MPWDYTIQDAARARHQYLLDQGHVDAAIVADSMSGWRDEGFKKFVYCDDKGKQLCTVQFVDEDGTAEVSFPQGEPGTVKIDRA